MKLKTVFLYFEILVFVTSVALQTSLHIIQMYIEMNIKIHLQNVC